MLDGENGVFDIGADCIDWLVSTLVMARVLGMRRWADEDLRFLLGPHGPAFVGEAGRDRLRGVMVPEVVRDDEVLPELLLFT